MKAFLLAAGHGTRLRPVTEHLPKCLVPVRGIPLLNIWLEVCRRAAIDEVLINLHAHADVVRQALEKDSSQIRVHLAEEPVLLGSAGTLWANREWVRDEPYFWVLYADVLTNADLNRMMAFHLKTRSVTTIGLYQAADPRRCGVATVNSDFLVLDFEEKPAHPKSNWAFSGVMLATPELLDFIPEKYPADLGFDVLPRLKGRMTGYPMSEYLLDIGTLDTYNLAQTTWPGFGATATSVSKETPAALRSTRVFDTNAADGQVTE
jgi:mannose-1-phosphate guanylyltransferase